jgi:hypothetical protein
VAQLARAHHGLAKRVRAAETLPPGAVLNLGAAVLFHGAAERELLFPLNPLLDFDVQSEYARRHSQLAEDLALLESLVETSPDSADVEILSSALLSRLKEHIAQDDRLFYQVAHDDSPK